jgi:hypothetical protein
MQFFQELLKETRMARKTLGCLVALVLAATGCVSESVDAEDPAQDDLGAAPRMAPTDITSSVMDLERQGPEVAYVAPNYDRRYWANSYTWSAARGAQWSPDGTLSAAWFNAWGNGGFCTSYSWGNQCNSSRDSSFITKGWGGYYQWGFGSWDPYGNIGGPSGWSTLGQHPYWCIGAGNTWQGWSNSNHC